jgi:tRNA(Arg) A34 adenosine deaminase TadA
MSRIELSTQMLINLPKWLVDEIKSGRVPECLPTVEEQMEYAIKLSRRNTEEQTGGPFGSVIVEIVTGLVKGVGVNRVVPLSCPLLHGETMAIAMATTNLKNFNLGAEGMPAHSLVTSAQPCAMCCGATAWSGVKRLVTGASGSDVESITGFDEGPIHPNWQRQLRQRGIEVVEGVLRNEACEGLEFYVASGGFVYNGSKRRRRF